MYVYKKCMYAYNFLICIDSPEVNWPIDRPN